jgi:hypothetical protein
MFRPVIAIFLGILWVAAAAPQSDKDIKTSAQTSTQKEQANASLPAGSTINAALATSLDSKKVKRGDIVTARTTEATKENGKTVIPRGAKLEGHVTQASARSKGASFSSLGIVFDKAILKHGEEVPLNVAVQAIAPPQSAAMVPAGPDVEMTPADGAGTATASPGRTMAGGGAPGGMASSAGNTVARVGNTDANNAASGKGAGNGLNAAGQLSPESRGVFGLQGIGLTTAPTQSQKSAAVITSSGNNVHLDSGTQLLLVTQAQAQESSQEDEQRN